MILNIHLEGCNDKGEKFRAIEELGKPFCISVVPVLFMSEHEVFRKGVYPFDYYYPENFIKILREFSKNPNVSFGQQGFTYYCPDCYSKFIKNGGREHHAQPDPWHENKCLYKREKYVDEQIDIMREGKKIIEDILRVSPLIYIPPNHQYGDNTKIAAYELGYRFFATRGILNLSPYEKNGLVFLPERNLEQKGNVFYAHYDQLDGNFKEYLDLIKNSEYLEEMKISKRAIFKAGLNERLIPYRKRFRDFKKIFK